MSDSEIIRIYLETRENPCFSLLYNRYAGKVFGKCLSILHEEGLAQDATQEIFTRVFANLPSFGEKAQFSTWVYSITYNYCIDFIRRQKKQGEWLDFDIERAAEMPDSDIPDEDMLRIEVDTLRKVLEQLPITDRMVLLMKYQDEMPIKEIAALTEKSESAVKMQLLRAKERAQKLRATMHTSNE